MTVGEAGNFLAYGFAPASIVSPLGVVALISNCVIAPIMLKEQFRLRDFWGVVVAVGGAVTVVLSARQEEKKLGPHEILGAITTTGFEVYMGVTVAFIVMLMWASPRYGNKTILVDLGLVGLFGVFANSQNLSFLLTNNRWLYSSFDQRCGFHAILDSLQSAHDPCNIRPSSRLGRDGSHAGAIREQSSAAIRFDSGYSCAVRHVHYLRDCWQRHPLPRL